MWTFLEAGRNDRYPHHRLIRCLYQELWRAQYPPYIVKIFRWRTKSGCPSPNHPLFFHIVLTRNSHRFRPQLQNIEVSLLFLAKIRAVWFFETNIYSRLQSKKTMCPFESFGFTLKQGRSTRIFGSKLIKLAWEKAGQQSVLLSTGPVRTPSPVPSRPANKTIFLDFSSRPRFFFVLNLSKYFRFCRLNANY